MAIQGALKVDCGEVFPHGLGMVSEVTPMADFNASTKENRVQARDKDTGLPVWQVEVLDFDQQEDLPSEDRGRGAAGPARSRRRRTGPAGGAGEPHSDALHRRWAAAEDRLQPQVHRAGLARSPVG